MDQYRVTTVPVAETCAGPAAMRQTATEHEHLMITHFSVIEGWLALLEDDLLDDEGRCRAATVLNARMCTMREDMMGFLASLKGECA